MSVQDFNRTEFAKRLSRVRAAVDAAELDWVVLFHPVSIHWITGSDAKSYQAFQCLLVSASGQPTCMITRESERYEFEQDALVGQLETWGGSEPEDPLAVFARVVDELGLKRCRVGMEVPAYYLHPHQYLAVKSILGGALAAEPTTLVHDLKLVKSPAELAYIRQAARMADDALVAFTKGLRDGETELALAGLVYGDLLRSGSGIAASTLNLVSGPRASFSHGAPTERKLCRGETGNIEYGATCRRYTATIGRQFNLGPPTARLRELHDIVVEAGDACMEAMREGVRATVPHEVAKAVIARAGLDRYRVHTTGYGLAPGFPPSWGEPVNMFGGNGYTLQAGMVLSVEPPIFIGPEGLGVRLIDNVLVTERGVERLTGSPREMIVA